MSLYGCVSRHLLPNCNLTKKSALSAAAIIGLRLPEERDLRNANEQVEHALASRSLVRRAERRRQI